MKDRYESSSNSMLKKQIILLLLAFCIFCSFALVIYIPVPPQQKVISYARLDTLVHNVLLDHNIHKENISTDTVHNRAFVRTVINAGCLPHVFKPAIQMALNDMLYPYRIQTYGILKRERKELFIYMAYKNNVIYTIELRNL